MRKELLNLIAEGKIEKAIEKLIAILGNSEQDGLYSSIILLSSRFKRNNSANMMGIIERSNYNMELNRVSMSLQDLLQEDYFDGAVSSKVKVEKPTVNVSGNEVENEQEKAPIIADTLSTNKSVFISYSHKESAYALKLKESLENQNVEVIIDVNDLIGGSDIRSFIQNSIKKATNTISIISMNSLLSSWVSVEVIKTIDSENIADKNFIPAFIDDAFFKRGYPDEALDKIEKEIAEIKELIKKRLDKGRNIDDLQSELTRYVDLKFHFPRIIRRLNDSLSVDIREDQFEAGVKSIIAALR